MYFECRKCHEKIKVGKLEDKQIMKIIAERHFREKHNVELIDHKLVTIN